MYFGQLTKTSRVFRSSVPSLVRCARPLIRILRRSFFPLRAAFGIFPRCQVANFVGGLPAGRYFGFDRHIQFLSLLLESQSGNPVCLD